MYMVLVLCTKVYFINMILRRLGNKKQEAHKIYPHFAPHKVFYDLFFGAGGMYFEKPKSLYNIVNDLDGDVFNLFQVVTNQNQELIELLKIMPLSEQLFNYWFDNLETDPIKKALRFLFLSSFSYMGKADTLQLLHSNTVHKKNLHQLIQDCAVYMSDTIIRNVDFREFFNSIVDGENNIGKEDRFTYADPPFLGVSNNYSTPKWIEQDSLDLFDELENSNIRFAMSEFDNPFILDQAEKRGLNVITIGERQNLKNKRIEILVTNYENRQKDLFR